MRRATARREHRRGSQRQVALAPCAVQAKRAQFRMSASFHPPLQTSQGQVTAGGLGRGVPLLCRAIGAALHSLGAQTRRECWLQAELARSFHGKGFSGEPAPTLRHMHTHTCRCKQGRARRSTASLRQRRRAGRRRSAQQRRDPGQRRGRRAEPAGLILRHTQKGRTAAVPPRRHSSPSVRPAW